MSIQVVAGPQSREFLLATLDLKIEQTRLCRNTARDHAVDAYANDTPIAEQTALARVHVLSERLDFLLDRRHRVTTEAL